MSITSHSSIFVASPSLWPVLLRACYHSDVRCAGSGKWMSGSPGSYSSAASFICRMAAAMSASLPFRLSNVVMPHMPG